jgi:SsrA-binding protein
MTDTDKNISLNRKAYHNYEIMETVEAGIVLLGTEIKSIRDGRVSLGEAFARPEKGEIWLFSVHIPRYEPGSYANHDPVRPRKLLLHKGQINYLTGKVSERGLTLVPLRLYYKRGRVKVELGLARGKKQYDKRQTIKTKEAEREMDRALKSYRKS